MVIQLPIVLSYYQIVAQTGLWGWLFKFWRTAGVIVRVISVLVSITGLDWWVSIYWIALVGQYDWGLGWL